MLLDDGPAERELGIVQRLGALDRLFENLGVSVAPAAEIVAERIDARGLRRSAASGSRRNRSASSSRGKLPSSNRSSSV